MLYIISYLCFLWFGKEFDVDFYRGQIKHRYKNRQAYFRHYLFKGWRLGLDPCPWFSGSKYLSEKPFLRMVNINPFLYFCSVGLLRRDLCFPSEYYDLSSAKTLKINSKFLRGSIDSKENGFLTGWVMDLRNPGMSLELSMYIDGKLIFESSADVGRPDLEMVGFVNSNVGFEIAIPNYIVAYQSCEIIVNKAILWKRFQFTSFSRLIWDDTIKSFLDNPPNFYGQQISLLSLSPESLVSNKKLLSEQLVKCDQHDNNFKISVIMPVRNRSSTIVKALDSILDQTYTNWEIIIINDASTDLLCGVLEEYLEENWKVRNRINVVNLDKHCGVSYARNLGLSKSEGDIIAYLDSDNSWECEYLEFVVAGYLNDSSVTNLYCAQNVYYKSKSCDSFTFIGVRVRSFDSKQLTLYNFIDLNCYTHKYFVFKDLGGFDPHMTRLVDWEFIIKITRLYPPGIIPYALSNYFIDSSSARISNTESYIENYNYLQKKLTK